MKKISNKKIGCLIIIGIIILFIILSNVIVRCEHNTHPEWKYFSDLEIETFVKNHLVGKSAQEAENILNNDGYVVNFYTPYDIEITNLVKETYNSNSNDDFYYILSYKDSKYQEMNVSLIVEKKKTTSEKNIKNETLEEKLEKTFPKYEALSALENYGKQLYPYGFKVHSIIGCLASTALNENTWYLKYKVDITNMYGATAKDMICEANITKINNSTCEVSNFNVL